MAQCSVVARWWRLPALLGLLFYTADAQVAGVGVTPPPTTTIAPLPSWGGDLNVWWAQYKHSPKDLASYVCAGAGADGSLMGECAETVSVVTRGCVEHCHEVSGGQEFYDDTDLDACAARDSQVCYDVCVDEHLFDDRQLTTYNESAGVRAEREHFWKEILLNSSARSAGDNFWMDDWEWKAEKEYNATLHAQFDSFWDKVCEGEQLAFCKKDAAKKTSFLKRTQHGGSMTTPVQRKAFQVWFKETQFPIALSLSATCHSHRRGSRGGAVLPKAHVPKQGSQPGHQRFTSGETPLHPLVPLHPGSSLLKLSTSLNQRTQHIDKIIEEVGAKTESLFSMLRKPF